MAERISNRKKRLIIDRAQERCEYCKSLMKYSPQPFVIEHILPKSLHGKNSLDNLALACGGCNGHKYNKTNSIDPVTGLATPLFHPRRNSWNKHFEWDSEFGRVIGISPTGRATVLALHLNRRELIHLRRLTTLTGEHPPPV
jgi:hypothetical protein